MDVTTVQARTRADLLAWIGTVCRLVLAGFWLWAGIAKTSDLPAAIRAVNAYQIMPFSLAQVVGSALPFVEIGVGLLLLAGLATRVGAIVSVLLLGVFVVGIASAWARGLRIDCGCFGGGGQLAAGQDPRYGLEIARDLALLAAAAYLAVRPLTRFSLDKRLMGTEEQ